MLREVGVKFFVFWLVVSCRLTRALLSVAERSESDRLHPRTKASAAVVQIMGNDFICMFSLLGRIFAPADGRAMGLSPKKGQA